MTNQEFTIARAVLPLDPPTTRERQILNLLATGLTNRAIAETLSISVPTVKTHVHHILGKLRCVTRTEAAHTARKLGLLTDA